MLVNVFVSERERERERERPWYKRQEKVRKAKRSLEAADWLCIFSIAEYGGGEELRRLHWLVI